MRPLFIRRCLATVSMLTMVSAMAAAQEISRGVEHPDVPDVAALETFVDGLVNDGMAGAGVPGLVVTVVDNGRVVLAKGYGMADLERGIPMTPRTALRAGSVSKPVSATAVLQLAAQGKLSLDAPIDRYLPGLVRPDAFGPASTVAQLLTMTGGYTDDVLEVHAPTEAAYRPLGEFLEQRLGPREIRPGVMSYSSWGIALLGRAMERVTGEPFDEILRRSLFEPLRMTDTTFAQPLPARLAASLATGYFREGGRFTVVPNDLVLLSPGIALVTTGEDMGRFMAALMPLGRSAALPKVVLDGLLERQAGAHPLLRGRTYGFSETWFGPPGTLYHDGNGIGFASRMILVPRQRVGIFVSTNHRALGRSLDQTPAFRFVKLVALKVLARLAPGEPAPVAPMPAIAQSVRRARRFAGQYQSASPPRHNLLKVGMLLDVAEVRANGDGTLSIGTGRYREISPGLFQNQEHPGTLAFFQDGDGQRPRYLTFGGTATYERVPWYGGLGLQAAWALVVCLLSLLPVVLWATRRVGFALACLGGLASLAFLVGFGAFMVRGDLLLLFKEIPLQLRLVLTLPWIGAAFAAAIVASPRTWRREPRQGFWDRLAPRLAALASLALLVQVIYWRLFP